MLRAIIWQRVNDISDTTINTLIKTALEGAPHRAQAVSQGWFPASIFLLMNVYNSRDWNGRLGQWKKQLPFKDPLDPWSRIPYQTMIRQDFGASNLCMKNCMKENYGANV